LDPKATGKGSARARSSTHTIAGAGDPRRITRSRIDLKSAGILQAANEGSAEPAISARDERNDSQPILNRLDFHRDGASEVPGLVGQRNSLE
jgi:hypothetical protein